jgi:hypothetical protein
VKNFNTTHAPGFTMETGDHILANARPRRIISDDNMGVEWLPVKP